MIPCERLVLAEVPKNAGLVSGVVAIVLVRPALVPVGLVIPKVEPGVPPISPPVVPVVNSPAAVGVEGFENGLMTGVYLKADDGTTYSLVIRPLLPDETA